MKNTIKLDKKKLLCKLEFERQTVTSQGGVQELFCHLLCPPRLMNGVV